MLTHSLSVSVYVEIDTFQVDITDLFFTDFELINKLRCDWERLSCVEQGASPRHLVQALDAMRDAMEILTSRAINVASRVNDASRRAAQFGAALPSSPDARRITRIEPSKPPSAQRSSPQSLSVADILAIRILASGCRRPSVARQLLLILCATASAWTPTQLSQLINVDTTAISATVTELARKGIVIGKWQPSNSRTPGKHRPTHGRRRNYVIAEDWQQALEGWGCRSS